MYSFISFLGGIWLFYSLPETRGLSLEKISECFGYRETRKLVEIKDLSDSNEVKTYGAMCA